jgi:hypothetical protein
MMMKMARLWMLAATLGLLSALPAIPVPVNGQTPPIPVGASVEAAGPYLSEEIDITKFHDQTVGDYFLNDVKHLPAVAYNSVHDEYLVVWDNQDDIYARRVSGQGEPLDWFVVAPGSGGNQFTRAQPSVAYDPVNDRYLVVFIHDVFGDGSDWDLGGRFIPWDGQSNSLLEFPIVTWTSNQWNPKVVPCPARGEFMVTWTNTGPFIANYISAATLDDATGAKVDEIPISSGAEHRQNPDVAYNWSNDRYLFAWEQLAGVSSDIFGLRVTGSGMVAGSEIGIAGWPAKETVPAVAACWKASQYLVAWQSDQYPALNPTDAIYARFVTVDSTPAGVNLIADSVGPERAPDVSCNLAGNQYLVVWQTLYTSAKFGIWGRLVFPDTTMGNGFAIVDASSSAGRTNAAIAAGRTNYLVVWEHERDGTAYQDIHGRLVTPPMRVFLPLVMRNYP